MIYFWIHQLKEPLIVYIGAASTFIVATMPPGTLSNVKNIVVVLVGAATFVYTMMKIVKLSVDLWKKREALKKEARASDASTSSASDERLTNNE